MSVCLLVRCGALLGQVRKSFKSLLNIAHNLVLIKKTLCGKGASKHLSSGKLPH